jgi:hypothetical protein
MIDPGYIGDTVSNQSFGLCRFTGEEGGGERPERATLHQNLALARLWRGHLLPEGTLIISSLFLIDDAKATKELIALTPASAFPFGNIQV